MKALVTGGAGFIGSYCVEALLSRAVDVTVLDDFSSGKEANLAAASKRALRDKLELKVIRASIADPKVWEKMPRHDSIFHLAAQNSLMGAMQEPERDFDSNVLSAKYIMNWIIKKQVRVLIYANSAGAVYGRPPTFPTDERVALGPISPYGATKSFFETYIAAYVRSLKDSGAMSGRPDEGDYFSWASLRLGNIYGPREISAAKHAAIPTFIEMLSQGKAPIIYGDGNKSRDYLYIDDCVEAFMAAYEKLQSAPLDEAFNLGAGIEIRDIDVFDSVLEALEERSKTADAAPTLKKNFKACEPNFVGLRPGEIERTCLNINKIEAFLDWRPRVDFKDGVIKTVNAFPF